MRILSVVAQLVGVDGGKHVGGAERLPDVPLALHLAHGERVQADAVGGRRRPVGGNFITVRVIVCPLPLDGFVGDLRDRVGSAAAGLSGRSALHITSQVYPMTSAAASRRASSC